MITLKLIIYKNYVHYAKVTSLKIKILTTRDLVKMYIKHQELFKRFSKKNVFSLDLKLSSSLIAHGNLFQSNGAAAVNALPPGVFFVFVDGGTNKT